MAPTPTTPPGPLSPDGLYRWDGTEWQPAQDAAPALGAPQAPIPPGALQAPAGQVVKKKGHMGRNIGLGCLGLILLIVVIAVATNVGKNSSGTSTSGSSPASGASSSPAAQKASPASQPPKAIAPIQLSGTGQTATQKFTVTQGLAIIAATCNCSANFSVELLDSSGATKDIAVNVIGTYSGSVGEGLDAAAYSLKISADAAWTITITQPRGVAGVSLPHPYTGKGQQTVGPFSAGDAVKLAAQNTAGPGGGNFAVTVLASDGSLKDVAFNEIGSFNGSTVSNGLSGGPYWLKIDSDGSWTITVSSP